MAYGNPYGELYDPDMILSFVYRLHNLDIKVISLADTIGTATPELIETSFTSLNKEMMVLSLVRIFILDPINGKKI